MVYLVQLYFKIKQISENHSRSAFKKVYLDSDFNMHLVERLVKKLKKNWNCVQIEKTRLFKKSTHERSLREGQKRDY